MTECQFDATLLNYSYLCGGAIMVEPLLAFLHPDGGRIFVISVAVHQNALQVISLQIRKKENRTFAWSPHTASLHTGWERAGLLNSLREASGLKSLSVHSFFMNTINSNMYSLLIPWMKGQGWSCVAKPFGSRSFIRRQSEKRLMILNFPKHFGCNVIRPH